MKAYLLKKKDFLEVKIKIFDKILNKIEFINDEL